MSVENNFSWEWKQLAGESCLFAAPLEMTDNLRWIAFLEGIADAFRDGKAFVIADVRGIEERIDLAGFEGIIELFKAREIERACIAVISTDQFHGMTAQVFQRLANVRDFNLQIEVFLSENSAESWMAERIERG